MSAWRFCWLIERQISDRPAWRSFTSFKPEAGWTHDANEALQFSRKKDADDFMAGDCGDGEIYEAVATEHGFMGDDAHRRGGQLRAALTNKCCGICGASIPCRCDSEFCPQKYKRSTP